MYSLRKHFVNFSYHQLLDFGEAIYIIGNIEELLLPIRLEVIDESIWSQKVYFNLERDDLDTYVVEYKYFVALYDNPNHIIKYLTPDERSFKLKALKDNYMMIHDKEEYLEWENRIIIKDPKKLIHLNLVFPYHVEYGEAIYVLGPLEDLDLKNTKLANRLEWNPNDKWKITIDIEPERIFKNEGVLTFIFIKSFFFKRDINYWIVLGNSRSVNMKKSMISPKNETKDDDDDDALYIHEAIVNDDYCEAEKYQGMELKFKFTDAQINNPENISNYQIYIPEYGCFRLYKSDGVWQNSIVISQSEFPNDSNNFNCVFQVENYGQNPQQISKIDFELEYIPNYYYNISVSSESSSSNQPSISGSSHHMNHMKTHSGFSHTSMDSTIISGSNKYRSTNFVNQCIHYLNLPSKFPDNSYSNDHYPLISRNSNYYHNIINGIYTLEDKFSYLTQKDKSYWEYNKIRDNLGLKILKEYTENGKNEILNRKKVEIIEDDCKKILEKLVENKPEIKNLLDELKSLNSKEYSNLKIIHDNNFETLRLKIVVLVKKWGLKLTQNQITEMHQIGMQIIELIKLLFDFVEMNKIIILKSCILINEYCKKHFIPKCVHASCQIKMQNTLKNDFREFYTTSANEKTAIMKSPAYMILFDLITKDLENYIKFAAEQGLSISWGRTPQLEKASLTLLMNYSVIYNIARYFEPNFPNYHTHKCGEFDPYCQETANIGLNYANLDLLLNKYLEVKGAKIEETYSLKERIIKVEEQLVEVCEKTMEKEVLGMIQIVFDLEKLKNTIEEGIEGIEIDVIVNDIDQVDNEADNIDKIDNLDEKFVKIRDLKNHANYKSLVSITKAIDEILDD